MATRLGVSAAEAVAALRHFSGVARRFDVKGEHDGIRYIDDYAHLPAEIAAALATARVGAGRANRVVAVFQPNRFHRIAQMADAYADCFVDADLAIITDIYSSGTEPIAGVTGQLVVDAVRRAHPELSVEWCADRATLASFVNDRLIAGDVCVSMGCGDIATLPDEVMAARKGIV
jgi:UDP-N-acetylmuramate--alanine ligase